LDAIQNEFIVNMSGLLFWVPDISLLCCFLKWRYKGLLISDYLDFRTEQFAMYFGEQTNLNLGTNS